MRRAIRDGEADLGSTTALLYGAGVNVPQLIATLDEGAFEQTVATKVKGARNVLACLDPERLRLLVTFGSLIARTGLRGEADYAVANEGLTALTERWKVSHPAAK